MWVDRNLTKMQVNRQLSDFTLFLESRIFLNQLLQKTVIVAQWHLVRKCEGEREREREREGERTDTFTLILHS